MVRYERIAVVYTKRYRGKFWKRGKKRNEDGKDREEKYYFDKFSSMKFHGKTRKLDSYSLN